MQQDRLLRLDTANRSTSNCREWLANIEPRLRPLLPFGATLPLTTSDLSTKDSGPVDVFYHFGRDPRFLHTLLGNYDGLSATAQCTGADATGAVIVPEWPGFEEVWIPISEDLQLYGRIGWAQRDGQAIDANCIVVLPGLFGTLTVTRTRDVCDGLRRAGLHALALELRGTGKTELRYPKLPCTFGMLESADLLRVSEWLEQQPHVRRTGLIGFCWGANEALLAAYEDGRPDHHPSISPALRSLLAPRNGKPHYTAGVIAFSPVLNFEGILDDLERTYAPLANPVLASVQDSVEFRARTEGYTGVGGSFRKLIWAEVNRTPGTYPQFVWDGLRYLRLTRYGVFPDYDKLECSRVPTLLVHAANDPLAPAQFVADQMAHVRNANVAALILPGGGHVGFSAWSSSYLFSLLVNFFADTSGAAAPHGP